MLRATSSMALLMVTVACAPARPTANERPKPNPISVGGTLANPPAQWITSSPATMSKEGVSVILTVSVDEVYALLNEAYAAVGIEVSTVDSRTRTLGNASFRAVRRLGSRPLTDYVRCAESAPGGLAAATRPVHLSVLSIIAPAEEFSRLTTKVQATTSMSERPGAVLCSSTGMLEAEIANAVNLGLLRR